MRAYQIAFGTIAFQAAIPIAIILGISGPINLSLPSIVTMGLADWHTYMSLSGVVVGGVAAKTFELRIPVGALLFAGVYSLGNIGLNGVLNQLVSAGYFTREMQTTITALMTVVFLFAFIQLASQGGKGSY